MPRLRQSERIVCVVNIKIFYASDPPEIFISQMQLLPLDAVVGNIFPMGPCRIEVIEVLDHA